MSYTMKMTQSLTVTFSGSASELQSPFFPEIILDVDCDYSCALLDLMIKSRNEADMKKIVDLNVLRINCDIIFGSYINGERTHAIHQFVTRASRVKGVTLVEIPTHLTYFPIKVKNLRSIQIALTDQAGKSIDIVVSELICRINIKRDCINEKSA